MIILLTFETQLKLIKIANRRTYWTEPPIAFYLKLIYNLPVTRIPIGTDMYLGW